METLNLDELKIKLSDYSGTNTYGDNFLANWRQVTDITDKLRQGKLEIPDQYKLLEGREIKIGGYAQNLKQTAEKNGFQVLDAQVSKYFLEQEKVFVPPKAIICVSGTLDDIAQAGIKTAAELLIKRANYDSMFPNVDIDIIDDYLDIVINYQKNKARLTKVLTKPNKNQLLDFQKYLQEIFNIQIDLKARKPDKISDNHIAKRRKKILDDLKNPDNEQFKDLIYEQLAGNTSTHADFMLFGLEQNKKNPNIYVADLRQFLFARAELKNSKYFRSYVAFVPNNSS